MLCKPWLLVDVSRWLFLVWVVFLMICEQSLIPLFLHRRTNKNEQLSTVCSGPPGVGN
jgi:hypothetical protein